MDLRARVSGFMLCAAAAGAVIVFYRRKARAAQEKAEEEEEIVILGAGVAGAAAAYHLSLVPEVKSVYVLETGKVGLGSDAGTPLVDHAVLRVGDTDAMMSNKGKKFSYARASGTAVFQHSSESPTIKMIVNVFPCSCETFIANHGEEGARSYLRLAYLGLELEKKLARKVLSNVETQLVCLGSLYVCLEEDVVEFEEEYNELVRLGGKDIELWPREKVQSTAGDSFFLGMFFPHDAVIDSTSYAQGLLREAVLSGKVRVKEQCSPAVKVDTVQGKAVTTLRDGTVIRSEKVIVATGGAFLESSLAGILTPCFSYLVSIPEPTAQQQNSKAAPKEFRLASPNSVNFFSWHFTHDWCLTQGKLRCSGEDHFSALKPPRSAERCASLAKWTVERLPYLAANENAYTGRYGIYSETPDHAPLIGTPHPSSCVCYLLGCNAWGQASLSFAASLAPALLGFRQMSAEENECFKVLDIRRYALLRAVIGDN